MPNERQLATLLDCATNSWRRLALLLYMAVCPAGAEVACAASGNSVTLPALPNGVIAYSKQSGLRISVDSTWIGSRGYRPVQIVLSKAKPATSDTQITVSFHAGFWQNKSRSITVEQDLELHQGATKATVTLLVPQYIDWNSCGWETWVDGKKDEELSIENVGFNMTNSNNAQRAALVLPGNTSSNRYLNDAYADLFDFFQYPTLELPKSWASFSCLDVVVTTPEGLQLCRVNSPDTMVELLRWVRAGGNLWVLEVGSNYTQLDDVEKILGLQFNDQQETEESDLPSPQDRGWSYLALNDKAKQGADALVALRGINKDETLAPRSIGDQAVEQGPNRAADSGNWFVAREYGMGTVVAFQDAHGRGRFSDAMTAVQLSLLEERSDWERRHGNDPGRGNTNFADFLIPDVGTAPVIEFQLLISLFVLGIGPLNYWLLKRRNQLPMLLVTVPAAALAATLLLFGYGLLADGFSVRVRARSITLLDQDAGEAACWSRLSYYAGFAPSDGLKVPSDTVVYPILPTRTANSGIFQQYDLRQRELLWNSQQNLTRGWMNSRTPTQYLAISARSSEKKISFEKEAEILTATNHLGSRVLALAVQDHDGNFFLGAETDVDSSIQLKQSNVIEAMMHLRPILTDNVLEFPPGYMNPRRNNRSWRNRSYDEFAPISANLMEAQIDSIISPLANGWGNGTYIAVTETGIEVALGVDDAVEADSFHVVRGTWTRD